MIEEDVIPPGSEWCNDKELESKSIFGGRRFTLGWWDIVESDDPEEVKRSFRIDMTLGDAHGSSGRDIGFEERLEESRGQPEESHVSTDTD